MLWEQTIIIEDTKEKTFVINNDNSREVINIKEECKIKIKQSYLCSTNIQFTGYTHTVLNYVKTLKTPHLRRENAHSKYQATLIIITITVTIIIRTPKFIINDARKYVKLFM